MNPVTCICPACVHQVHFGARCEHCGAELSFGAFKLRLAELSELERLYRLEDPREARNA